MGRKPELPRLNGLLADPEVRLVTVLGGGGMGKTRLALETAKTLLCNFERGVYLIALAPLDSAENIV